MSEKNLEQLQETHSEMLATAADLGLELPEELKADFTEVQAGQTILSALDTLIREHLGKGLANDDKKGQSASALPKPKKSASAKTTKKPSAKTIKKSPSAKEPADTAAEPADVDPPEQESTVAAKKPSTKAKKGTSKKASSKAATANARTRSSFDEKSKIVKTGKENPAREKSGKYNRIDNVLKHNGKTVGLYLGAGKGKTGTLSACVKLGLVKVV